MSEEKKCWKIKFKIFPLSHSSGFDFLRVWKFLELRVEFEKCSDRECARKLAWKFCREKSLNFILDFLLPSSSGDWKFLREKNQWKIDDWKRNLPVVWEKVAKVGVWLNVKWEELNNG